MKPQARLLTFLFAAGVILASLVWAYVSLFMPGVGVQSRALIKDGGKGNSVLAVSTRKTEPARIVKSRQQLATRPKIPALESIRVDQEGLGNAGTSPVRILADFETAVPLLVRQLTPTHFEITIDRPDYRNWFIFQVVGAKGKILRLDIVNAPLEKWATLNPMYCDALSLDETYGPDTSASPPLSHTPTSSFMGIPLPDTSGQRWHYIPDVWSEGGVRHRLEISGTLCTVHRYESNSVVVSMRCPLPPSVNERFMAAIPSRPNLSVTTVGTSSEGRPLQVVKITGGAEAERRNPAVLIYAGEHPDEEDTGWTAWGVIDFLTSESDDAKSLLSHTTFFVVPVLDPDGAAAGLYKGRVGESFEGGGSAEAVAYYNYFVDWLGRDRHISLILDLHNVESGEGPHLYCACVNLDQIVAARGYHALLLEAFERQKWMARKAIPLDSVPLKRRLCGALSVYASSPCLLYEVNSQARMGHLAITDLKRMGRVMASVAGEWVSNSTGRTAEPTPN